MTRGAVDPSGRDSLPRYLVVRDIPRNAFPNPFPIAFLVRSAGPGRSQAKQVAKPERPEIDVLGSVQQHLDQLVALLGVLAGYALAGPVRRRQGPCDVQANATQELAVARQL